VKQEALAFTLGLFTGIVIDVMSQPLKCSEFVQLVTDYLEGVMSAENHRPFEEHLEDCHGYTRLFAADASDDHVNW